MEVDTPIIIPDKIILRSIRVLGGNIEADDTLDPKQNIGLYDMNFDVTSDIIPEEKLFRFVISMQIQSLDKDGESLPLKGSYKIEFIFFIENLESFIKTIEEETKSIIFHAVLPDTLASIVYSTSRGIVWSRTQGTSLEGVMLPVINPKELLSSLAEKSSSK
jgi:hypothetical protein